jgi:hypothetical protein
MSISHFDWDVTTIMRNVIFISESFSIQQNMCCQTYTNGHLSTTNPNQAFLVLSLPGADAINISGLLV